MIKYISRADSKKFSFFLLYYLCLYCSSPQPTNAAFHLIFKSFFVVCEYSMRVSISEKKFLFYQGCRAAKLKEPLPRQQLWATAGRKCVSSFLYGTAQYLEYIKVFSKFVPYCPSADNFCQFAKKAKCVITELLKTTIIYLNSSWLYSTYSTFSVNLIFAWLGVLPFSSFYPCSVTQATPSLSFQIRRKRTKRNPIPMPTCMFEGPLVFSLLTCKLHV